MKKYLVGTTIILLLFSCSSCKSRSGAGENSNSDSVSTDSVIQSNHEKLIQTDLNQIGDLSLGMNVATIIGKLGKPESTSAAEVWDADGWIHQDWEYLNKGISLNMSSENENVLMEIFSISISAPCTFKTNKHMGIGNTYDEVMAAYKNETDPTSSDENVIVVGSLYGGIIFEFDNKKVTKIFLGAAAE